MDDSLCYRAGGLDFVSEIEMPGAILLESPGDFPVSIRFGEVPESLSKVVTRGAAFEVNAHEVLVKVPAIARYWVRNGQEILVQPEPNSSVADVRAFLITSPFGAIIHQRGFTPLHASAVRVGDECVAIVGPSRAGKSTLSATLNSHGFPLVADDVVVVKQSPLGPMACPGFCRLRLWQDTAEALGIDSTGLPRVRQALNKFELHVMNRHCGSDLPLRKIYLLQESNSATSEGITQVSQPDSLTAVMNNTYRLQFLRKSPAQAKHFQQCASMTKSIEVAKLFRPDDLSRLNEVVEWLKADWARERVVERRAA